MAATQVGRILLMPKGTYNVSTTYNMLDWVRYSGSAWICKVDGTVGITPTEGANWTLMASDGSVTGNLPWGSVTGKPFDDIKSGGGLSVDGSKKLELDLSFLTGSNISYDNTASGLTATTVQLAIDELAGSGGSSTLSGLSDVNLTSPSNNQILKYDSSSSKWVNGTGGGHTMLPDPSVDPSTLVPPKTNEENVVDAVKGGLLEGYPNDDVPSLNTLGTWSNCEAKLILTTAAQGDTQIGVWNDAWKTDNIRTGWLWSADLYQILEDGSGNKNYNVEVIPTQDIGEEEVVSVYAYRIDDDVTYSGQHGGAVAIKFNGAIQSASGVKVGVKLVHQRTEVNDTGTILS